MDTRLAEDDGVAVAFLAGVRTAFVDDDLECSDPPDGAKRFSCGSLDGGCSDFALRGRELTGSFPPSALFGSRFCERRRRAPFP